jgi:hypothetical protein
MDYGSNQQRQEGERLKTFISVNSTLDSIRTAYQFNLNWYPAYSYSDITQGYNIDSVATALAGFSNESNAA